MKKRALIVGAGGQDGRLLQAFLRPRGYSLGCLERTAAHFDDDGGGGGGAPPIDISRFEDVEAVVARFRPDHVYHLAAVHHSSQQRVTQDLALFRDSYEINFFSLLNVLEAVRQSSPRVRVFYAASSHVFGHSNLAAAGEKQDETTPFRPESAYAMSKVDGILCSRQYRERHQIFAAVGILFNHESSLRREQFLSKKVVRAAVAIKRGSPEKLVVGDLRSEVDWGYAPDYVEAMHAILELEQPDDFVIASGTGHSVEELVALTFAELGLDWREHVQEDAQSLGSRRPTSLGDASKLRRLTGWRPRTSFAEMIRLLVREELQRLESIP